MCALVISLVATGGYAAYYCLQQIQKQQIIINLLSDAVFLGYDGVSGKPDGNYHQQLQLRAAEPLIIRGHDYITTQSRDTQLRRQPLVKSQQHIEPLIPFMHKYYFERKGYVRIPQGTYFHIFARKRGEIFDATEPFIISTEPIRSSSAILRARDSIFMHQIALCLLGLGGMFLGLCTIRNQD